MFVARLTRVETSQRPLFQLPPQLIKHLMIGRRATKHTPQRVIASLPEDRNQLHSVGLFSRRPRRSPDSLANIKASHRSGALDVRQMPGNLSDESGLFPDFAQGRDLKILILIDGALRKRVAVAAVTIAGLNYPHATVGFYKDDASSGVLAVRNDKIGLLEIEVGTKREVWVLLGSHHDAVKHRAFLAITLLPLRHLTSCPLVTVEWMPYVITKLTQLSQTNRTHKDACSFDRRKKLSQ